MKFSTPKVLLAAALLCGQISHVAAESGWIYYAKVTRIVTVYNGGINVRITPELTSCTSQSGYGPAYASVYPDNPGLDKIHSILLAAYMANKPVSLYLADGTCKVTEVELGGPL